jgi:hypothetical protein
MAIKAIEASTTLVYPRVFELSALLKGEDFK